MFIEPNTNIRILKGVPLDTSYKNTLYFSPNSKSEQTTYFMNKTKHNLTNYTYQRVEKGKARIGINAEALYDCNYMMFQNTSFGTKWFYAFITGVEYVNNAVSEITFEIDVMQTWYFDYELKECFVEREHSETDNVGDNIVVEPIDIGDIICGGMSGTNKFDSYVAVIATAYNPNGQSGGTVGGLFTGLNYVAGLIDNAEQEKELLDFLDLTVKANKQDSIVSIFVMPSLFYTKSDKPVVEVLKVAKNTTLSGYTPRNKKLLTYPYNFLGVECGNNSCVYRYEYFTSEDDTCQFTMTSAITPNPEIALIPVDYNGADFNYVEKLVMKGFPQVGYAIDSFRAWLAQEASSVAISAIGNYGVSAMSALSGNPMGVLYGSIGLVSTVNNVVLASNRPPQARGNDGASVDIATRTKNFWFKQMHITEQYAKILDDFFDMYGYSTQRTKIPSIANRPHWNYVKTKDCTILGSLPSDDIKKICDIFDSGITFWKNGSEVGDYSLDNSPQ